MHSIAEKWKWRKGRMVGCHDLHDLVLLWFPSARNAEECGHLGETFCKSWENLQLPRKRKLSFWPTLYECSAAICKFHSNEGYLYSAFTLYPVTIKGQWVHLWVRELMEVNRMTPFQIDFEFNVIPRNGGTLSRNYKRDILYFKLLVKEQGWYPLQHV